MRLLLDLPATDNLTDRHCFCGAAMSDDPTHPHACKKSRRCEVTDRHNHIESVIAQAIEAAGGFAKRQYCEDGSVPDITASGLYGYPGDVTVDVTVLHALTPSNLNGAVRTADKLLLTREQAKRRRYAAQELVAGRSFFPFAVDSYGVFAPDAVKFLSILGNQAQACYGINAKTFVAQWSARVLRALHIGNVIVMLAGANRTK